MKTTRRKPVAAASVAELVRNPPTAALPPEWLPPEPNSPRGRILAAARRLFAEQGLEATSIRDITAAAAVNSAMVHYYFGSKELLYERVLGFEFLSIFQSLHAQIAPDLSPGELLLSLPLRIMRAVRGNPVWAKLISREMAMGAPHSQKVVMELKDAGPLGLRRIFQQLFHAAAKNGELNDLPPLNVIQFLLVIGYCGVFYEPFFRILLQEDPNKEAVFEARLKTFDKLIRHGLVPVKANKPKR